MASAEIFVVALLAIQEREAHERAVAARIEYQIARQPKPVVAAVADGPAPRMTDEEWRTVREALDRYFQENGGRVPIF